jgi:hypothetical protein
MGCHRQQPPSLSTNLPDKRIDRVGARQDNETLWPLLQHASRQRTNERIPLNVELLANTSTDCV